jgi:GPH family glycoside/pentoside/hexuronide:cation symporter
MAVGSIWEVMCGPVAGYLSDNTLSRYGKRKPYLIFASAPVAITMWLLFTSFELPYTVKVIYFLIVMLLFQMTFSSFFVPYMAWGSDLTEDYDERTLLRSYAYVFNQVGMALGMVVPTVFVDLLMRHGFSVSLSWSAMGAFVGIISGASLLICALGIHESDDPEFVKPGDYDLRPDFSIFRTIITDYLRILKVRPVQFIVGTSLLYLVANTFFIALGRPQILRYSIIVTSTLCLIYNIVIFSIGGILLEAISVISAIVGSIRFLLQKKNSPVTQG